MAEAEKEIFSQVTGGSSEFSDILITYINIFIV